MSHITLGRVIPNKPIARNTYPDEARIYLKLGIDGLLIIALWLGADIVSHALPTVDQSCIGVELSGVADTTNQACQSGGADESAFHWWAEACFYATILIFSGISWFLFLRKFAISFVAIMPRPPLFRQGGPVYRCMLGIFGALMLATIILTAVAMAGQYEHQIMQSVSTEAGRWDFFLALAAVNGGLMIVWLGWKRRHYEKLLRRQRGRWMRREASTTSNVIFTLLGG